MALIIVNHIEGKDSQKPEQMTIKNQSVYEILSNVIQESRPNKNHADTVK